MSSRFSVLEDEEDDDVEMESAPAPSVGVHEQHHIGNVAVFVQFNRWEETVAPTYLGLVSHKIACGTIQLEGSDKKENCFFAIYPDNKACNKHIRMLVSLHHPNLLNGMVYGVRDDSHSTLYNLALNPISGTLEHFFEDDLNYFFSKKNHVLSDNLVKFLRVLIDVVSFVHHKGFCHGNVHNKNIFYLKKNGDFMFFLGTYGEKVHNNLRKGQVSDWNGLGWTIESIKSAYIEMRRKDEKSECKEKIGDKSGGDTCLDFICVALQDLIDVLIAKEEKNLICMKEKALNSLAFQNIYHRQRYMTVVVPYLMRYRSAYNKMLDQHLGNVVKMPWTSSCGAYYNEMTKYRKNINPNRGYDVNSGKSFVDYISAAYTHCHEFQNPVDKTKVDFYFRKNCPILFQALKYIEGKVFPEGAPIS